MTGYDYTNRAYPNDWNKSSYPGNGYSEIVCDDHVCRLVIVDAEGRKRPIPSYGPNHGSEGYVTSRERIVEHVHTPVLVSEYPYSSPTKIQPSPVQTEASRPTRPGLLSPATNWHNSPNSGAPGYGNYGKFQENEWNKPNGYAIRDENVHRDGWDRPGHSTQLSGPTSDIGKALEILKEAVRPSASRFTVPVSTGPKTDTYTRPIDPARRYGNFNLSARPYQAGEGTRKYY